MTPFQGLTSETNEETVWALTTVAAPKSKKAGNKSGAA